MATSSPFRGAKGGERRFFFLTIRIPSTIRVVAAAIIWQRQVLIGRRQKGGSFGEKWEFPGGKIEPGEDARSALIREIQEELGVDIEPQHSLGREVFLAPNRNIDLELFSASLVASKSDIVRREHLELTWVDASNILSFDFAAPDVPLLEPLIAALTADKRLC